MTIEEVVAQDFITKFSQQQVDVFYWADRTNASAMNQPQSGYGTCPSSQTPNCSSHGSHCASHGAHCYTSMASGCKK